MINNLFIRNIFKYQLIILVGIFVVLFGLLFYHLIFCLSFRPADYSSPANTIADQDKIPAGQKIINGLPAPLGEENVWPVAVSIDNHPDARPLYGLSKADIVYEFLVEGGATRFLAFYTPTSTMANKIEKIGPVRSVRPYFLPIAKEYEALLAHSGGSVDALKDIEKLEVYNLEEIAWWGPDYFWRVYSRTSPHNLFTSSDKLATAIIDWKLGGKIPVYTGWRFFSELERNLEKDRVEKIAFDFSGNTNYRVEYVYSTSTKSYLRSTGGSKDIDALSKKQVSPENILIQFIPAEKTLDAIGRLSLDLLGDGEVWLFRDGVKILGQWQKTSPESRTQFFDANGNYLPLKPGQIWIEIIPGAREIELD
ncbi:DUF3048 domain-containing protein [Candidatus Kuenenbacteria bacterium]|nr:DUF3048 domain-containing protein [Candidatus Kuenenbacteria bacterium]